ncbi:MAG: DUF3102 domain-containing protein [Virgibacillus sp.]|nr:DUF3102 domain-containing protein [Virgibacillus sp.]
MLKKPSHCKDYEVIYKTGQAIFEIGKRLKHVKENDLVHGEFGKWLEDIGIHERQAQRLMKVASELGDSKATTWSELPFRALYEIATLPQEEREKEQPITIQNKEVKQWQAFLIKSLGF